MLLKIDTQGADLGIFRTARSQMSRRAAGSRPSGAACAEKGASGRMQRPPELVPIPCCGVKASEGFGKLRKVAAFWKNPEKVWSKFSKTLEILQNLCKKSAKIPAICDDRN